MGIRARALLAQAIEKENGEVDHQYTEYDEPHLAIVPPYALEVFAVSVYHGTQKNDHKKARKNKMPRTHITHKLSMSGKFTVNASNYGGYF